MGSTCPLHADGGDGKIILAPIIPSPYPFVSGRILVRLSQQHTETKKRQNG